MSNATWQFSTYCRYLEAAADLAGLGADADEPFRPAWTSAHRVGERRRTLPHQDLEEVRQRLEHSWAAEALLYMNRRGDAGEELLKLTNVWSPVQGYYACYHSTQALIVAGGADRPTNHRSTQRAFLNLWQRSHKVLPWCLSFGSSGPERFPTQPTLVTRPATSQASPADLLATALSTTWRENVRLSEPGFLKDLGSRAKREFEDEQKQRREAGRRALRKPPTPPKRIPPDKRRALEQRVPAVSVLDLLYRLRIRSNYEDAHMALQGARDREDALRFLDALLFTVSALMAATENRVCRIVGPDSVVTWMDNWLTRNIPPDASVGLRRRGRLIARQLRRNSWIYEIPGGSPYLTPLEVLLISARRVDSPTDRYKLEGVLRAASGSWNDATQTLQIDVPAGAETGDEVRLVELALAASLIAAPVEVRTASGIVVVGGARDPF